MLVRETLAALALGGAILLAYASSLQAGFAVDNVPIIRDAARVHAATWGNVAEILSTDYWWPGNVARNYRPLATLSYMLNWAVFGNADRPTGYHWVNLLLHWANAILVFALGRRALGLEAMTAFLVALLFATHPVATEAVTNIVGRADLLAATSVLGGLLLYVAAVRAATARGRALYLTGVAASQLLGLLSKENAVVLAGAVVLYDLVFRLRADGARRWPDAARELRGFARTGWVALAPPLAAVWLVRSWIYSREEPFFDTDYARNLLVGADPWTARLTALKALGRSTWILLWPARLCPDYSVNQVALFGWRPGSWEDAQALLSLLGIAAALVAAVRLRRRAPAASFLIGFYLLALVPTSNLILPIGQLMAERFLYLPLVGFAGCVVLAAEALATRLGAPLGRLAARSGGRGIEPRAVAWGALALLAVAYGVRTAQRNLDWRDDLTLFTGAVESCPGSYKSYQGLAGAVAEALQHGDMRHGDIDRVIELEETAVGILERNAPPGRPVPQDVLEALGSYYLGKAILEAERERAVGGASAASSTAWAARAVARLEGATAQYEASNDRRRRLAGGGEIREAGTTKLYNDLGLALLYAGHPGRAVDAFARARQLDAGDAEAYSNLASAYLRAGRTEDALVAAFQALLIEPKRDELRAAVYQLYQQVDPGGCAFTADAAQLRMHSECPASRRYGCRAYSGLVAVVLDARNIAPEERRTSAARLRRAAEQTFRCSELGYADLRP